MTAAELAHHFPTPILAHVGDEIADSLYVLEPGRPRPLALFDAVRVDYSLRRHSIPYSYLMFRLALRTQRIGTVMEAPRFPD